MKRLKVVQDQPDQDWISEMLTKIAFNVPLNSEQKQSRRETNTRNQAIKRSNVKEAANILPKRQKYAK